MICYFSPQTVGALRAVGAPGYCCVDHEDTQRTLGGERAGGLGPSPSSALICLVRLGKPPTQNLTCEVMSRWPLQPLLSVGA